MGLFATWRHIKALKAVEERMDRVEAMIRSLDLEWSDVHSDLAKMLAKISKRAKVIERAADGAQNSETGVTAGSAQPGALSGLTVGQLQAQREIDRRRQR